MVSSGRRGLSFAKDARIFRVSKYVLEVEMKRRGPEFLAMEVFTWEETNRDTSVMSRRRIYARR